tara:strand:- start:352 stop:513 length:162 start_codon:yes stop_codon:yes gene_type:complete
MGGLLMKLNSNSSGTLNYLDSSSLYYTRKALETARMLNSTSTKRQKAMSEEKD